MKKTGRPNPWPKLNSFVIHLNSNPEYLLKVVFATKILYSKQQLVLRNRTPGTLDAVNCTAMIQLIKSIGDDNMYRYVSPVSQNWCEPQQSPGSCTYENLLPVQFLLTSVSCLLVQTWRANGAQECIMPIKKSLRRKFSSLTEDELFALVSYSYDLRKKYPQAAASLNFAACLSRFVVTCDEEAEMNVCIHHFKQHGCIHRKKGSTVRRDQSSTSFEMPCLLPFLKHSPVQWIMTARRFTKSSSGAYQFLSIFCWTF